MRTRVIALLMLAFALTPGLVFAQNASVQFNRWDAQITTQSNSDQLQIAETQEVQVMAGTVSHGTRYWTDPVQVQSVYMVTSGSSNPQQLAQGSANQPGSYSITQSGNQTQLQYTLPTPVKAGNTFTVQINYTATSPTTGMVDWKIIPADHSFPVNSSTVTIHFPDGQVPDSSLIANGSPNANVQVSGNDVIIQSRGPIPAQQAFGIQVPFGTGVSAAAGNPNTNPNNNPANNSGAIPPQNQPDNGTAIQMPGLGTILLILCVVGVLLLVGGGALLRSLLGGFL